jgi:hypothetical protein
MTTNAVLIQKIIFILNEKLLEELIPYFLFTVILVFDTSREKTLEHMHNIDNKTIQFGRPQCCYY